MQAKTIKDVQLAEQYFSNRKKEVEELIHDYKLNGMKNFVPYEDGNDELLNFIDLLIIDKRI